MSGTGDPDYEETVISILRLGKRQDLVPWLTKPLQLDQSHFMKIHGAMFA